jgi:hypothetical protein
MSGDPDPGHQMPPLPPGWDMTRRPSAGITLPVFHRRDSLSVKFSTERQAWACFLPTGERRAELGWSHTPGAMMELVDRVTPLTAVDIARGTPANAEAAEFDALFRDMLARKLFTIAWRDGAMALEITPKGIAALTILECVKAGSVME